MSGKVLGSRIDGVALVLAENCNPNGDTMGNIPRHNEITGQGVISPECIKRKIRNALQDAGEKIYVQMEKKSDDGCRSLAEREAMYLGGIKNSKEFYDKACEQFIDVRAFGQVFSFKDPAVSDITSMPVTGCMTVRTAESIAPVDIIHTQITKSVNGSTVEEGKRGSDTMGNRYMVRHGLYKVCFSINAQLAQKNGFTEEDAEKVKEAVLHMFDNDVSSARPAGSMEVVSLVWAKHKNLNGDVSPRKVFDSVSVKVRDDVEMLPASMDDYTIEYKEIPGFNGVREVLE